MTARWVIVIALLANVPQAVAQQSAVATTEQPRSFGYMLGDVIAQRVLLHVGNRPFEPSALPPLARTGAWLTRRTAAIETDGAGNRWLVLEYQVINAPQTLAAIALPALTLASRTSGGAALSVAAWPVSVAPLTPRIAFAQGALQPLQPDRQPSLLPTAPLKKRLTVSLVALALVMFAWFGWWLWRNHRDARQMPFARAWHALKTFDAAQVDHDSDAWRQVHRALNDTAGQALHPGTLDALFVRVPYLEPMRARIERFYAHSGDRFYALAPAHEPYRLLDLCRDLRRLERRNRR
ncbi:calcium incorporation protein MxaA [Caballeronia sp. LZ024]|uniref:calcium incorporation protein MxaA n=2 Tax=unclassified Caballeronia TaxID=2646786 RepID=UPI0028580478|nr:calcium incorporation protein MxaA [Caballeronia sp. LZ024]MDR5752575.1 calcium incorporation protein MxaA [Caballeronia sp. LZ024]